jgi:hypothetical protein
LSPTLSTRTDITVDLVKAGGGVNAILNKSITAAALLPEAAFPARKTPNAEFLNPTTHARTDFFRAITAILIQLIPGLPISDASVMAVLTMRNVGPMSIATAHMSAGLARTGAGRIFPAEQEAAAALRCDKDETAPPATGAAINSAAFPIILHATTTSAIAIATAAIMTLV